MTFLTIDEINNNCNCAPLGHEQEFIKRIMLDEFKSKKPKKHMRDFCENRRVEKIGNQKGLSVGSHKINWYKQFNRIHHKTTDKRMHLQAITINDYKRFFKEIGVKPEKGAKKDWYVKMFSKYQMGLS